MAPTIESSTQSSKPGRARKAAKPAKPYEDFPLFAHASGRWAKKIHGKFHYFGSWANGWQAALDTFLEQRDALYAKRKPRAKSDGADIKELLSRFRTAKLRLLEAGEIVQSTYKDYVDTCDTIRDAFGTDRAVSDLAAEDFEKFRTTWRSDLAPLPWATKSTVCESSSNMPSTPS